MSPTDEDVEAADDASDSEVVRYQKAFRETRRVLDEAILELMILEEFEDDSDRRDQLADKRQKLEAQKSDLNRANMAFHTHTATMVPPSASLVAEIMDLSRQAANLTIERASAAASLKLATAALEKFAEIQDIGSSGG
jgi:hypothetical protein